MKKNILLFLFVIALAFAYAQRPVNQEPMNMNYKGYTIHLLPAMAHLFVYDIIQDNHLVLHLRVNPFNGSRTGLAPADAFKVAQWQIDHQKQTGLRQNDQQHLPKKFGKLPPALQQRFQNQLSLPSRVPPEVAAQLGIKLNQH